MTILDRDFTPLLTSSNVDDPRAGDRQVESRVLGFTE